MEKSIFVDSKTFNLEKAKKECLNYKCVSFDVFDTLIKRNVYNPQIIFDILEKYAEEKGVLHFKNTRLSVEHNLRIINKYVTINDIYKNIGEKIGKNLSEKLKLIEIDIEKSYCQRNNEIYELYKFLKNKKKRIIAISDMYLTSDIINVILTDAGYKIDKLYVSCECKAKKKNGVLFKQVLEKEKIKRNEIIHIGDSFKADVFGAKFVGIKSYRVRRNINSFNISKFEKKMINIDNYNNYISIINNNLGTQEDYYSKFGFSLLGPLVYNYCLWLKNECEKNKLKKIFFFSRDGYVLKNAFDKLFQNEFDTKYIYFSRRSIRIPYYVIKSNYEDVIKLFPKTKLISTKVFFENFGLNPYKYKNILAKYNLKLSDNIFYRDLFTIKKYKDIYEEIHEDVKTEANKEYKILEKYLIQEKFNGKIAIVDVGWHNSMQYYLEQLFSNNNYDLEMYGFYVGQQSGDKKVKHAKSFIKDGKHEKYSDSVASYIGLIESVFLANEGSTKNYIEKKDSIRPSLLDYEYNIEDVEYQAFLEVKSGIDRFINTVCKLPKFESFSLNGYDAYLPLKTYGTRPYLKDITYYSKFRYLSEEMVYFANPKSLMYYLLHIKEFKTDMYKSRWKIGFMKQLFKIPLPYLELYQFYHEKKER